VSWKGQWQQYFFAEVETPAPHGFSRHIIEIFALPALLLLAWFF
jgi:hypothetical protein